jgi:hypothetical protein
MVISFGMKLLNSNKEKSALLVLDIFLNNSPVVKNHVAARIAAQSHEIGKRSGDLQLRGG